MVRFKRNIFQKVCRFFQIGEETSFADCFQFFANWNLDCRFFADFSRKHREGFLVKKRLPCLHQSTYTAHIHCTKYTPAPTQPTYSTYIVTPHRVHQIAHTDSIVFYLISQPGLGLAGVGGVHPSAGMVRVETLSLWRRANFQARGRSLCGDRVGFNALACSRFGAV